MPSELKIDQEERARRRVAADPRVLARHVDRRGDLDVNRIGRRRRGRSSTESLRDVEGVAAGVVFVGDARERARGPAGVRPARHRALARRRVRRPDRGRS